MRASSKQMEALFRPRPTSPEWKWMLPHTVFELEVSLFVELLLAHRVEFRSTIPRTKLLAGPSDSHLCPQSWEDWDREDPQFKASPSLYILTELNVSSLTSQPGLHTSQKKSGGRNSVVIALAQHCKPTSRCLYGHASQLLQDWSDNRENSNGV